MGERQPGRVSQNKNPLPVSSTDNPIKFTGKHPSKTTQPTQNSFEEPPEIPVRVSLRITWVHLLAVLTVMGLGYTAFHFVAYNSLKLNSLKEPPTKRLEIIVK